MWCADRANSAPTSARNSDFDLLDVPQRHLQEAGSDRVEGIAVAGAEEVVAALAAGLAGEARALEGSLHRGGNRVAAADEADVTTEDPLQHRRHQRVMRTAEDQGVDSGLL